MCVRSSVWAKGGLGERQSQEAAIGMSSLDPKFLGRGLLSHPTLGSRRGPISLPNFLHRSLASQSLPDVSLLLDFPSLPTAPSPSQLPPQWYPLYPADHVHPPFFPPALGAPFGAGSGLYLVSSPGNPGSGRKGLGSLACTRSHLPYIQEWPKSQGSLQPDS